MGMATESAPNGANGVRPGGMPPGPESRSAADRAGRDAIRAAFLAGDGEPTPDEVKPDASVAETKPAEPTTDAPGAAEPDAEPEAKPAAAAKVDPETEKRLAAVQKAEARAREKLAAERKAFDEERATLAKEREALAADRAALDAYRKAQERAKVDPVGYLRAAGVTDPETLEYAAKQAYGAAKGDPANKEAAARALRERELADEVADLKRWRAEQEKARTEQAEAAKVQREVTAYVDTLVKTASSAEDAPLTKHFMAKSPEKTTQRLRTIAFELAQEMDDIPDHADVIARFEKTRRAELEEYGANIDSILKPEQKKPDPTAAEKTAAKTLTNTMSTSRVPRSPGSEREARAAMRDEFVKDG